MAGRRVSWFGVSVVHQEVASGIRDDNDENVNPMLGDEVGTIVQESHVLVRCAPQPRHHPRIPLRDITHLFPGNAVSLDNKADLSPPVQRARGNGPVRRPFPPASSQNSRKRRQPATETPTVRRVLRKYR